MDEAAVRLILEGGALGILVFLVIYQGRQAGKDRLLTSSVLDRFIKFVERSEVIRADVSRTRMGEGLKALDRVNDSLGEMTKAMAEFGKVMATHETRRELASEDLAASMNVIVEKLDKALSRQ